jgi:hypothetical protein
MQHQTAHDARIAENGRRPDLALRPDLQVEAEVNGIVVSFPGPSPSIPRGLLVEQRPLLWLWPVGTAQTSRHVSSHAVDHVHRPIRDTVFHNSGGITEPGEQIARFRAHTRLDQHKRGQSRRSSGQRLVQSSFECSRQ